MTRRTLRPAVEHLRIRHLRFLELLIEHGTIRKAAERIHASQPVASQMLAALEAAFGGELFTRTRSGVRPTARLAVLLRRIKVALGELEAASSEHGALSSAIVRVGANLQSLTRLLPPALARVHEAYPDVRFLVQEASSESLMEMLIEGSLDCAVARFSTQSLRESRREKEIQIWPLTGEPLCLVVNRNHPLAKRKRIRLADLAHERWASGTRHVQGRQIVNRLFFDSGLRPPQPTIECRPQYANLAFVAEMPLITIATRAEALSGQSAGHLHILPIAISAKLAPIAFACRKDAASDELFEKVREALHGAARNV